MKLPYSERTFLAWLRTSLSFASIGIAVTQLFRLNTSLSDSPQNDKDAPSDSTNLRQVGKPLGATFLGICSFPPTRIPPPCMELERATLTPATAIVILLLGFHRYFESQHYIIRGKFPASRGSIVIISFIACALIIASLVVVVSVAPGAFEKK